MTAPDMQMAVEPGERQWDSAETAVAASLPHGTLANVSAADHTNRVSTAADGPAVRDAQSIASRIAIDEAAADTARDLYGANGMPAIAPVTAFARVARAGEALYAMRYNAILERAPTDGDNAVLRGGTVFLTSNRLLHVGDETTEVPLGEIDEMVVALERLVLIRLRDGSDLAVEVDQPRLLRVQIAAAVAASRTPASIPYGSGSGSVDSR